MSQYDGVYLSVAQSTGSIDGLLDSFFSFLARKTDFYAREEEAFKKITQRFHMNKPNLPAAAPEASKKQPKIEEIPDDEPVTKQTQPARTPLQPTQATNSSNSKWGSSLNGNDLGEYKWSQNLPQIELFVKSEFSPIKGKDVSVDLTGDKFSLTIKGKSIIEGNLHAKVKDFTWTVEDSYLVHVILDKQDQMKWWKFFVTSENEIDTQKIQPENSKLSDLDGETRTMVEKMMFDQQQKQKGLPTSDQLKQAEVFEKFKKAHPEMDFSNCKVNY
jgi:N-terminal conserved domain of Nudc./CS domain